MRYLALVSDYDNTLASHGRVAGGTRAALERLRASGRRAILVTGRRLDDLLAICSCTELFDYVVAENGAILYDPRTRDTTRLGEPPPQRFIAALRRRGVEPLEVGEVVVATHAPQEGAVIETIRELGLELQVIFNRHSVMVMPPGINKASGVKLALRSLGMSPHEAVAVGDAENDHSFMQLAECPVAVANALDSIKAIAALVTAGAAGDGVVELIEQMIANDLAPVDARLQRRRVALGTRLDGATVWLPAYGANVLVAGASGSGKSTLATGLIERFAEQLYQLCVIDPEGDYVNLQALVTIGDHQHGPAVAEVMAVLRDPYVHANVSLLGVPLADRPAYFADLLPHVQAMRMRTGRPHWLMIDEAHHLLSRAWGRDPPRFSECVFITVHPERLTPAMLAWMDVVIAVGPLPEKPLGEFAAATGRAPVQMPGPHEGEAVCWLVHTSEPPFPIRTIPGRAERIRHRRKYAEGDVRYNSFYFRGPTGKHNLKAQNLNVFSQIAEGIGEETWMFHLRRHDYSRWMRDVIKNQDLAAAVEDIERRVDLDPAQTRAMVRAAVEARYTLPE